MADVSVREAISAAIRYWEPRRLLYNGVLLIVVATVFVLGLPISRSQLNVNLLLFFIYYGSAGECGLLRVLHRRCRGAGASRWWVRLSSELGMDKSNRLLG
jgi:hypothetical protein